MEAQLWDTLRREARRYERDLDARLAAFAKVCSTSRADFQRKGDTGLAAEQLAQAKALEIEGLLERLADINTRMGSQLGGVSDTQGHTLANHRDKLADYQQNVKRLEGQYSRACCEQEFRRLNSALGAARDRTDLFHGSSEASPLVQGTSTQLLRERGALQTSHTAIDDVLGQAYDVSRGLNDQGKVFDSSGLKLQNLTSRFPAVNGLLNSIKRRKNRDTLILSAVIVGCCLFLLIYWWNK